MTRHNTPAMAYITGGAGDIGAATALLFAARGAHVAVSDHDPGALTRLTDRWPTKQSPILITADLGTAHGVEAACAEVLAAFGGPPTVLVNNVGAAHNQPFTDINDAQWQQCIELNLLSHVRTCRVLLPVMSQHAAQDRGAQPPGGYCVVNVASDLAKQPEPIPADYGAMKAALLYLTKALAAEYAPHVRINAVCPGPVWTSLWTRPGGVADTLAASYGTDRDTAVQRYLRDRHMPLGMAQPIDVAASIAFLASPDSARITVTSIDIGGTIRGLI